MKTRLLTIFISNAIFGFAQADTIVIRDAENGKIVAEVDIDSKDSKFKHQGRTLYIERKAPVMELRARKSVLPRVQFRDASLDEVANWLRQPNPHSDEPGELSRPVINFVINDQAKRKLRISIYMEQSSLYGLLASLAKKYGLVITYDEHTITVTDPLVVSAAEESPVPTKTTPTGAPE